MYTSSLDKMVRGWFVGAFKPNVYETNDVEVAVKEYNVGDSELPHYHKISTEITVINYGKVKMFDKIWKAGDIIIIEPGDITGFEALEQSSTTVVKIPAAINDKYVVNKHD